MASVVVEGDSQRSVAPQYRKRQRVSKNRLIRCFLTTTILSLVLFLLLSLLLLYSNTNPKVFAAATTFSESITPSTRKRKMKKPTNVQFSSSPVSNTSDNDSTSDLMYVDESSATLSDRTSVERIRRPSFMTNQLLLAMFTSIINVLINSLRPDDSIPWFVRVPRILWEFCVAVICMTASSSPSTTSSVLFLLSGMLFSTAVTDIFFWAPLFAMFVEFETCTGGGLFGLFRGKPRVCYEDVTKGYGRVLVSIQAVLSGLIYMYTAIVTWKTAAISSGFEHERRKQDVFAHQDYSLSFQ